MKITSVEIRRREREGSNMLAIANIKLDDVFLVKDIRVINGKDGLFIAMPSKKLANGEFMDVCHPLNTETRNLFTEAVINEYNRVVNEAKDEEVSSEENYENTNDTNLEEEN